MAGIGGITYGQSQYAQSGSKIFDNKFFKEYLYFKEKEIFLFTYLYKELLAVSESFTTHLAILWERFVENILVTHTVVRISIKKTITNILALTDPKIFSSSHIFKESLKVLESIKHFARKMISFKEVVRGVHKRYFVVKKRWQENFSTTDNGLERISGFIHRDFVKVLYKTPVVSIKHIYTFFLGLTSGVKRKINGIPIGWMKGLRPQTIWQKSNRVSTDWQKEARKDI